jgi:acyl-CoA thioesterase I
MVLAFACLALGCLAARDVPASLAAVHKIVLMGDSITEIGSSPHGYVTLVAHTLNELDPNHQFEVINAGISGQKATDMHARFQKDVIDRHPDVVTLSVGVNDVWHDFRDPGWNKRVPTGDSGAGVKLPVYIQEVDAMATEAKAAGIRMVLVSPTLVYEDLNCAENQRLMEYVDAERDIARRHHLTFVDLNAVFRDVVKKYQQEAGTGHLLLTVDGVHMNDQGNNLMAAQILKAFGVAMQDKLSP